MSRTRPARRLPIPKSLLDQARALLKVLPDTEGWETEVFLESERSRDVAWADGRPKDALTGFGLGLAIRACRKGRLGFASGSDASPEGALRLWKAARAAAELLSADPSRRLPRPQRQAVRRRAQSPGRRAVQVKSLERRLARLENWVLGLDPRVRRVLHLGFSELWTERAIVSNQGAQATDGSTVVSFSAELLGESKSESQTAWGSTERRRWEDLAPESLCRDATRRLIDSFGAAPIPSGFWTVLLEPRIGVEFLELFSQAAAADSIQRGRSCLSHRRGTQVASNLVNLVDDGTLPGGLGTSRWDAEGCPTQRTDVVKKGTLASYLYDTETARRDGLGSTGNACRPGLSGPPSPGTTNFFLAPGRESRRRILLETPRAFVVRDIIGMHTADPVSGDFSVGAAGVLWEGGAVRSAVKGVTLSGNLLDLFRRVDAVAGDLAWHDGFGCPSLRVARLAVGGS